MTASFDPRVIYARTATGSDEVLKRSLELSPPVRRLLLLIDGRRPIGALPARVRSGEMPALLEQLLAAGLVVPSGSVERLAAEGSEQRDPQLDHFKRRLAGCVERELGRAGLVLEARLQDCVNMAVMRSVTREVIELVRSRKDAQAAGRVAQVAQAAHREWAARGSDGKTGPV
jgi:hypothetical protein